MEALQANEEVTSTVVIVFGGHDSSKDVDFLAGIQSEEVFYFY